MKQIMSLKDVALIDIEAFFINNDLGMPSRWVKNILAIIGAAFIKVKIWLGFKDPRQEPTDLKREFKKYGKPLRYYSEKVEVLKRGNR